MSSLRQIEANRRNSLKSTGPHTPFGKSVSRMNALKSGIDAKSLVIRGEDPAALEQLTDQYYQRFQPEGPDECALIDSAVYNSWVLRRLRKTEAEIWESSMAHTCDWEKEFNRPASPNRQADAYDMDRAGKSLDRVHCRMAALERALRTSLETLIRLRNSLSSLPESAVEPETNPIPTPPPSPANSETKPIAVSSPIRHGESTPLTQQI